MSAPQEDKSSNSVLLKLVQVLRCHCLRANKEKSDAVDPKTPGHFTNVQLQSSVCMNPDGPLRKKPLPSIISSSEPSPISSSDRHPPYRNRNQTNRLSRPNSCPNTASIRRQHHYQLGYAQRGGINSESSYSSSSLDEPPAEWSAYSPMNDIAWSPTRTHHYEDGGRVFAKSKSTSSILNYGGSSLQSKVYSFEMSSSMVGLERSATPLGSGYNLTNYNVPVQNEKLANVQMTQGQDDPSKNNFYLPNAHFQNVHVHVPVNVSLGRQLIIPNKECDNRNDNIQSHGQTTFSKACQESKYQGANESYRKLPDANHLQKYSFSQSEIYSSKRKLNNNVHNKPAANQTKEQESNESTRMQSTQYLKDDIKSNETLSQDELDSSNNVTTNIYDYESPVDLTDQRMYAQQPDPFIQVKRGTSFQKKTYSTISSMLDWEMDVESVTSSDAPESVIKHNIYKHNNVASSTDTLVNMKVDDDDELLQEVFEDDENNNSEQAESLASFMALHDLSPILIPRDNLRTGKLMLKGRNYSVCSGCLKSQNPHYRAYVKPVSVQIFREVNSDEDQISFLQNIMLLRRLQHKHILEILGVCLEGSPGTRAGHEVLMVTGRTHGYVTLQRLLEWCDDNNPDNLSANCALTFALQVLQGLTYLENQGIVHTNLTSSTIMLNSKCEIKLTGLEPHPISIRTPAYRWIAIESHKGRYTHKSTVWSVGILLWTLVTYGAKPYNELKKHDVFPFLCRGKRLQRPSDCPNSLFHIMHECWHTRPHLRPTFPSLTEVLTQYRRSLPPSPPPCKLFPDKEDFWHIVQQHV